MKKILLFTASLSFLVIAFSLAYYFVIFLPSKQLAETELKKAELVNEEIKEKESKLNTCLDEAHSKYEERWNNACERLGKEVSSENRCGLPSDQAKHYDSEYKNLRDECLTRYK